VRTTRARARAKPRTSRGQAAHAPRAATRPCRGRPCGTARWPSSRPRAIGMPVRAQGGAGPTRRGYAGQGRGTPRLVGCRGRGRGHAGRGRARRAAGGRRAGAVEHARPGRGTPRRGRVPRRARHGRAATGRGWGVARAGDGAEWAGAGPRGRTEQGREGIDARRSAGVAGRAEQRARAPWPVSRAVPRPGQGNTPGGAGTLHREGPRPVRAPRPCHGRDAGGGGGSRGAPGPGRVEAGTGRNAGRARHRAEGSQGWVGRRQGRATTVVPCQSRGGEGEGGEERGRGLTATGGVRAVPDGAGGCAGGGGDRA
jgi:hypothetical protein